MLVILVCARLFLVGAALFFEPVNIAWLFIIVCQLQVSVMLVPIAVEFLGPTKLATTRESNPCSYNA